MHAMIAISALVEGGAITTGLLIWFVGVDHIGVALGVMYGLCAAIVSLVVASFLSERGVGRDEVWCWREPPQARMPVNTWWSGEGTKEEGCSFLWASVSSGVWCWDCWRRAILLFLIDLLGKAPFELPERDAVLGGKLPVIQAQQEQVGQNGQPQAACDRSGSLVTALST